MTLSEQIITGTLVIEGMLASPVIWGLWKTHFGEPDGETLRLDEMRADVAAAVEAKMRLRGVTKAT